MPKICNKEDCNRNVFGGGFCPYHQYLRTDKKPKVKTAPKWPKRTPIRKISAKGRRKLQDRIKLSAEDKLFWDGLWQERPHIDFETGLPIWGEALTLYFHHVLPKGLEIYEKFRFCDWNIVFLSWESHDKAERKLDLVPKVKAYHDYLIKNLDQITAGTLIPDQTNFT